MLWRKLEQKGNTKRRKRNNKNREKDTNNNNNNINDNTNCHTNEKNPELSFAYRALIQRFNGG